MGVDHLFWRGFCCSPGARSTHVSCEKVTDHNNNNNNNNNDHRDKSYYGLASSIMETHKLYEPPTSFDPFLEATTLRNHCPPALDASFLQKKLSSGEFEIRSVKHTPPQDEEPSGGAVYRSQSIDSQRSSGVDDGRSSTGTRHSPGSGLKRTRYIGDGTGSLGSRKSDRCDGEDAESLQLEGANAGKRVE
uniref:Uncharacterized protein n=1 Tax=Anopheles merus TaxID=30066 RepID=A0A182UXG4_ANOME